MAVITGEAAPSSSGYDEREARRRAGEGNKDDRRGASVSPARAVLLTAIWLALITGGVEAIYWLLHQQIAGSLVFLHPGYPWMSPLAQLAVFLVPGSALAAVAWHTRSSGSLPFAATLLSLIGWLNLLQLLMSGLHFWAWILLACGLAAATGRVFQRVPDRCLNVIRRTTGWMIMLLVTAAAGQAGFAWHREASAVAALPESPEDAPNVLLVVLDTVRADMLADREIAPNLAEIAQQGVVLDAAWSTAPWTLPSMAGMFTGRLPHELSADWESKLDASYPTLAEELSARGWLTGGFVGNTRYCSAETGLGRGFSHYEAYRFSWADFALCTALGRKVLYSSLPVQLGLFDWPGRKRAGEINESVLDWLDRRPAERPFFAFLNYWDAHDPYFAAPEFQTDRPGDLSEKLFLRNWWWIHKEELSESQLRMQQGAYKDCIRGLDHQLGQLFDQLERRGELENTLVIITADHGEHFAEHGLFLHGNSLYEPLLHVPLAVVWPGRIPAGGRVDASVSLRGLPNTVFELLGLQRSFPGASWVRHWDSTTDDSSEPEPLFAEIASQAGYPPCHGRSPVAAGSMQCVRLGNMKYIHHGDGSEQLYDLEKDPGEQNNLADDPEHRTVLGRMREKWRAGCARRPAGNAARRGVSPGPGASGPERRCHPAAVESRCGPSRFSSASMCPSAL